MEPKLATEPKVARILHISDLHFGKPFLDQVGVALRDRVAAVGPDLIAVSGDLTQRAKPAEFEAAAKFLDSLPSRRQVVVPGNHDVPLYNLWERFLMPRRRFRSHFPDREDQVIRAPNAVIVGLDSTDPRRSVANGRIRSSQISACARAFEDVPDDAWRIVIMHHQLVPAPSYHRATPIRGARQTLDTFTELKVDVVLGGHLHRAYVGNSLDVYAGADRSHGSIVVQCGTSTSRRGRGRERETNSMNLIELRQETLEVTHYMYLSGAFQATSYHEFARPRRRTLQEGLEAK